jgi:hypothetical protein
MILSTSFSVFLELSVGLLAETDVPRYLVKSETFELSA